MAQQLLDELLRGSKNVMTRKRIINFYMNTVLQIIGIIYKDCIIFLDICQKVNFI